MKNKDLKKRILDLSYKYKLSHIGSCLTAVDIIDEVYKKKKPDEKFILSSGHAGLALYVVIEKYEHIDAEKIWLHHGVHPDRCESCHLYCSTGSLGQGLPIAVGMALANRKKKIHCLISDGECSEGSIWEALRIIDELAITNLELYFNFNGWGAYKSIDSQNLKLRIVSYGAESNFYDTDSSQLPFLKGLDAHYHTMTEEEYKHGLNALA